MTKVLFILKFRQVPYSGDSTFPIVPVSPNGKYSQCMTAGLFNSANLVNDMLNKHGIESKVVEVVDNNDIDREVAAFKPTHVMIEALWVVPEKFNVLRKLHPHVKWVIRIHSETPFLANEGIAMKWMNEYIKQSNVYLAPNSERMYNDLVNYYKAIYEFTEDKVIYLPNFYEREKEEHEHHRDHDVLNVGCFGAIRPLKNQLIQAFAAVEYTRNTHKKLRFHINSQRIEQKGDNVLLNLRAFFKELDPKKYELVEHAWMHHDHFRKVVSKMDIGLQVSFSETFNIVTADFVMQDIPVVVSSEIEWVAPMFKAETGDARDIASKMGRALTLGKFGSYFNRNGLQAYNKVSVKAYLKFLRGYCD